MSKVTIIVLALVSLMLGNTLASGQDGKAPPSVWENAAASAERTIGMEQIALAFHDASRITYLRIYCTPDNNSHFQSGTGKLRETNFAPPAAPLYIGNNFRASTAFLGGFDAGWVLMT